MARLIVRGDIDQTDYELVQRFPARKAEVRLAGMLNTPIAGGDITLPPGATTDIAHPSLGEPGGGDLQIDPKDPKGLRSLAPIFEARVELENAGEEYCAGQRAYVRLTLEKKPLAWIWTERFLQLIQSHDTGKWI